MSCLVFAYMNIYLYIMKIYPICIKRNIHIYMYICHNNNNKTDMIHIFAAFVQ